MTIDDDDRKSIRGEWPAVWLQRIDDAGSEVGEPWQVPELWAIVFSRFGICDEIEISTLGWDETYWPCKPTAFPEIGAGIVKARKLTAAATVGSGAHLTITLYIEWV